MVKHRRITALQLLSKGPSDSSPIDPPGCSYCIHCSQRVDVSLSRGRLPNLPRLCPAQHNTRLAPHHFSSSSSPTNTSSNLTTSSSSSIAPSSSEFVRLSSAASDCDRLAARFCLPSLQSLRRAATVPRFRSRRSIERADDASDWQRACRSLRLHLKAMAGAAKKRQQAGRRRGESSRGESAAASEPVASQAQTSTSELSTETPADRPFGYDGGNSPPGRSRERSSADPTNAPAGASGGTVPVPTSPAAADRPGGAPAQAGEVSRRTDINRRLDLPPAAFNLDGQVSCV